MLCAVFPLVFENIIDFVTLSVTGFKYGRLAFTTPKKGSSNERSPIMAFPFVSFFKSAVVVYMMRKVATTQILYFFVNKGLLMPGFGVSAPYSYPKDAT